MPRTAAWRRAAWLIGSALGSASGCLLVAPLEEYPEPDAVTVAGSSGMSGGGSAESGAAGETASAGANGSNECNSNADCVRRNFDEPYRCRPSDHTCVPLKSDACPLALGDAAHPQALYFGAFATLNPQAPAQNAIVFAHQLALEELSGDTLGGLPGPDGTRRPLVMIVCSNHDKLVDAALSHLSDEVRVPAILATLKPGDLRRGFELHAARELFYLSPVAVTETLATADDSGLIWNLLGEPADLAPSYAELLKHTEKYVRSTRAVLPSEAIRVALVTTLDAFDAELTLQVEPALRFNGLTTLANAKNYAGFTAESAEPEQLASLVEQLVTFRPHIVVSTGSELVTMPQGIIEGIEVLWEDPNIDGHDQHLPQYLLSPYNAGDLENVSKLILNLREYTGESSPERRFIGLSIAGAEDTTLQNEYAARLGRRFKNAYSDTANYYDAVYFLAYAMHAAGTSGEPTGRDIARGMRRLLSGKAFNVGPTPINLVFKALSGDTSSIELKSTLGPPGFDPKSGVKHVDGGVFCFEAEAQMVSLKADVLRYDRAEGAFRATEPFCFTGLFP